MHIALCVLLDCDGGGRIRHKFMIEQLNSTGSSEVPMAAKRHHWLPMGIAAVCVGLIAAGAWLYYRAECRQTRSMVETQLSAIADLKARQILDWRNERLSDARFFSRARFVAEDVQAILAAPQDAAACESALYWLKLLKAGDRYDEVTLFDADFTPRVGVPDRSEPPSQDLRTNLERTFRTGRIVMTDLYRSGPSNEVHLDILFPVFAPEATPSASNAPQAVVLMRLDPREFLYPLAQEWPLPSQTGEVILVRREGDEVVCLNELRHRSHTALNLRFPLHESEQPASLALQGKTGVIEGTDYRGVPVLATFRPIQGSSWYLGTKVDQAEVFAPLRSQVVNAGMAAVALTLAVLLGLGWFWREREARFLRRELASKAALQQSEARYRRYVDESPLGVFVLDTQGRFLEANPAACAMTGFDPLELCGMQLSDVLAAEDREAGLLHFKSAKETGHAEGEVMCRREAGGQLCLFISAARLSDDRVVVFAQDVTDRNRAEVVLLESAHQVREAQRIAHLGSYVFDVSNGDWSSSAILDELFGIDGTFTKDIEGWLRIIHPDEREELRRYLSEHVIAGRQPFDREYRILRQNDGEERWVHGLGELMLNERGEPMEMIGTIQDITERRKTELALERSEAELSAIYQHAPIMMLLLDEDGRVHRANKAALAFAECDEVPADTLSAANLLGCVHALEHPKGAGHAPHCMECSFWSTLQDTLRTGLSHHRIEISPQVRREPQVQNLAMLVSTARLSVGDSPMVLVCLEDITDHRRLEEQFRQSQKMEAVGQLAGGVAHDFNNILAAMLMHLQLLQETQDLAPEVAASLKELESGADRAAGLTRQLLLFSRRQAMQTRRLDVNQTISGLMKMLRRLLGEHISIVFDSDSEPLWVQADAGMLEQVTLNLCVNARDAMPKGGQLTLSTHLAELDREEAHQHADARVGRFVRLTVADNGCGMDAETMGRMYEPFFSTKQPGQGTGLGLATVYGIVQQHRGWIEVNSVVGVGTTFHVYLPMAAEDLETTSLFPQTPRARGGSETILLVEDDDSVRGMVRKTLSSYGYDVLEASNGHEAVQIWETDQSRVRMLFTDMVMPGGLTGLELAEKLRQSKPDLKILITSGYSSELQKYGGRPPVGMDFLPKPYNTHDVARVVRGCLDGGLDREHSTPNIYRSTSK